LGKLLDIMFKLPPSSTEVEVKLLDIREAELRNVVEGDRMILTEEALDLRLNDFLGE
jgi:hypothetical protein